MTHRLTRRVAVTGMGIISALGANRGEFAAGLFDGRCGIGPVTLFDISDFPCQLAAQVRHVDLAADLGPRERKRISRCDLLGLIAAGEALADAGLDLDRLDRDRVAVVLGGGAGGMRSWERFRRDLWAGQRRLRSSGVLAASPCTLADLIASRYRFNGVRTTITTACSSSASSIGYGFDLICSGAQQIVMAGGSEALSELTFAGFNALRVMSPERCRPFDRRRNGLSLGEGAAVLVLEELRHAVDRGAVIYGEVLGYAVNSDAFHMTSPDPESRGMTAVMAGALARAGVPPERVDYVNAHGTATRVNDLAEATAIKNVFGGRCFNGLTVSSTKSMVGHCLGASGAIEAVATLLALHRQVVPPTVNLDDPDPECGLDFIPNNARHQRLQFAVSNSFAFGGNNTALVFGQGPVDRPQGGRGRREGRDGGWRRLDRCEPHAKRPDQAEMTEIVVTGIGIINAMGVGREAFWDACRAAASGLRPIAGFDTGTLKSNIGAEVRGFDPAVFLPARVYRRMSPISKMTVAASVEALADSGLDIGQTGKDRVGVIMGTAYGSSSHVDAFYLSLLADGPRGAQPFLFPETVPNAPAGHMAIFHGITGPNATFCQNAISAETAMLYARDLLAQGVVDAVLVGGAEELSEILQTCYDAVGALNPVRALGPEPVAPTPGGGLVLGEGAGVLVMERAESARARGARIYGRLVSGIVTGAAAAMGHYALAGDQLARSLSSALALAGVAPADVQMVSVSANFSRELDPIEHAQLVRLFADRGDALPVTPLKYLMGDFGAAGVIRAAALLLALYHQQPLPTVSLATLKGQDPGPPSWQFYEKQVLQTALMTGSSFGGGSCSMVFSRA